jgi:hypothetical protein
MKITPIYNNDIKICDILYNDNNEYIIITSHYTLYDIKLKISDNYYDFYRKHCSHKHTTVYICNHNEYYEKVDLIINHKYIINTNVNKYHSFKDEIIISTCVKNEDNYIIRWIEYYKLLGVSRFIIYDNNKNDYKTDYYAKSRDNTTNLERVLEKYIENNTVILIEWPFEYKFQMTQQTHSIHTFKNSKYIGLLDIDEYVNPHTENINLDLLFNNYMKENNIYYDNIGGIMILSKMFHNPENIDDNGYNFMNSTNCGEILPNSYQKIFVIPKNVFNFSCHHITNGKRWITIEHNLISINHYFFLNKTDRGTNKLNNYDDSILNILKKLL